MFHREVCITTTRTWLKTTPIKRKRIFSPIERYGKNEVRKMDHDDTVRSTVSNEERRTTVLSCQLPTSNANTLHVASEIFRSRTYRRNERNALFVGRSNGGKREAESISNDDHDDEKRLDNDSDEAAMTARQRQLVHRRRRRLDGASNATTMNMTLKVVSLFPSSLRDTELFIDLRNRTHTGTRYGWIESSN